MKNTRSTQCGAGRISLLLSALMLPLASGCVTVAEFRKLERQVVDMQFGAEGGGTAARVRIADLSAQIDDLTIEIQRIEGRLEVSERRVEDAMREAETARAAAAGAAAELEREKPSQAKASAVPTGSKSGEVEAYRSAHNAWRAGDSEICVDRFRNFLQTYPASAYADDAAYWLADCYFKQGDYKTAVLRFDDVVSRHPDGTKAADALYRQGEALLRLGPGYGKAAGKAFERVLKEYPGSGRATEAKRQLDILGSG